MSRNSPLARLSYPREDGRGAGGEGGIALTMLLILCLLGRLQAGTEIEREEAGAVASLQRAGAKLQSEPIASEEFLVCVTGLNFTDVPIGDSDLARGRPALSGEARSSRNEGHR